MTEPATLEHLTPNQQAWRRFRHNRLAWWSTLFLGTFLLLVTAWPLRQSTVASRFLPAGLVHSSDEVTDAQFAAPSPINWCGTDVHGRDLLARLASGARISLVVGLFGAAVSLVIGVLWGALAGYLGGRCDSVLMRMVDVLYSLPSIIFVIVLIATLDGLLKSWNSPLLGVADLRDVPALVHRLQSDTRPPVQALRQTLAPDFQLPPDTVANGPAAPPPAKTLVAALNRVINGAALAQEPLLRDLPLRARTRSLLEARQDPAMGPLLNRSLLEDLFPGLIRRHDRWYAALLRNVFSAKLGASTQMIYLFIGLGAVSWLTMARIVRGEVLSLRTRSFVEASRALGAGHARILCRHILPNVAGVIIVYLTLTVPSIVLYESFLSYLGLGIQPPQASLGSLIAEGAAQINPIRIYWWMIVFPAATLASLLLALNFVGDGLRDALDPRAGESS